MGKVIRSMSAVERVIPTHVLPFASNMLQGTRYKLRVAQRSDGQLANVGALTVAAGYVKSEEGEGGASGLSEDRLKAKDRRVSSVRFISFHTGSLNSSVWWLEIGSVELKIMENPSEPVDNAVWEKAFAVTTVLVCRRYMGASMGD